MNNVSLDSPNSLNLSFLSVSIYFFHTPARPLHPRSAAGGPWSVGGPGGGGGGAKINALKARPHPFYPLAQLVLVNI